MNNHIIQKGESLWTIAQQYGISLAELLAANPQISDPNNIIAGTRIFLPEGVCMEMTPPPLPMPQPMPRPGLPEFSAGMGLPDMSEDERGEVCEELRRLPRPLIYVVKKNDNIYQLAKCFDISMKELLQVNPHIQNPDMIYPGDKIFIPRQRSNINLSTLNAGSRDGIRYCPTCGSKLG